MQNNPAPHQKFYALNQPIESFFSIDNRYDTTIYWKNNDSIYYGCNNFQAILGNMDLSKVAGTNDADFFNKKIASQVISNDFSIITGQLSCPFIEHIKCGSNQIPVLSFKTPLKDSANHSLGIFGFSFILNNTFELDLNLVKPFLNNCNAYNLIQSYQSLIMLFENDITPREAETLYYFIRCKTIKDISLKMGNLAPRTVEFHLNNCKNKLGTHTINEMLAMLWDNNFAYLTLENIFSLFL